ncbi:TSUP family transporter [Peribacillus sp. AS_2]|uniref:TSUP family transporter n=1 Tax=Peribacillus sp. AS_2 TaxID=2996755 RepID=UPI0022A795C7|nr:TSUP family transporter [Peribacillus sp. AS_2]MCZ0872361.1 TSUP family transporter [Peribacillus sp. AS_2]
MFSSFSSFYILLKKKQLKLKDALQLIPFALFGGLCGGLLANSFPEKAMNLLAICLLTVALILNFIKKPQPSDESDWHLQKKVYPSYSESVSMTEYSDRDERPCSCIPF